MKKVIKVEKMSCNHCKNAVESAALSLEGVKSALVDLKEKTLTLECDETKVTAAMLKEVIEEEGFMVV